MAQSFSRCVPSFVESGKRDTGEPVHFLDAKSYNESSSG